MTKLVVTIAAAALFNLTVAHAGPGHTPPKQPKALTDMQTLVGTWIGTGKMGKQEMPVTVVYESTSGGTVITEKLMAATPQEMVSVYHKDGDSVSMTHYCAMGNQPRMRLKKSDGKTFAFEMTDTSGITSANESHMHAATLTLVDKDTLKAEWVQYEGGKKVGTAVFMVKRKK